MAFLIISLLYFIPIIGIICICYQKLGKGDTLGDLLDELPCGSWIPLMNLVQFALELYIYVKEEWFDNLTIK